MQGLLLSGLLHELESDTELNPAVPLIMCLGFGFFGIIDEPQPDIKNASAVHPANGLAVTDMIQLTGIRPFV